VRPLGFRQVDRSLRAVEKQLRSAVRGVNQHASKLVAKGKYEEAQAAVALAQAALRFQDRFESVILEWQASSGMPMSGAKAAKVPLWRCYVVIARTLKGLGGEATLRDVIANVEATVSADPAIQASFGTSLTAAEWKRAVERARSPMKLHGYIEAAAQGRWKLTKLGRDLADRQDG